MSVDRWIGGVRQRLGSRGSRGFLTVGAAGTVLLTALAVTFGAPQHARLLDLLTGHGWLTTDQPDQVMLANGQTGQLDFRLTVGRSGDPVDVVQSGQNALLVDGKTGQAGAIDVSSLKIVNSSELSPGGSLGTSAQPSVMNQVLPGPKGTFYVVHRRTGQVEITDPLTDKTLATTHLGGALSPAVDAGGTLWTVTTGTGAMVGVDYRDGALHEDTVHSSVVGPGNDVQLSVVDGAPAVLDKSRNVFFTAPGGVPGPAVSLPPAVGSQATVASVVTGPVVPIAAPGKVVLVSGDKANVVDLNGRGSDQLGAPTAFADKIYVPDLSDGSVVVLNDAGQQVGTPIDVTKGPAPQLSLSVQNGALFINNPASPTAYSVTTDGVSHLIAKTDPNVPSTQTVISSPTTLPSVPKTVAPPVVSVPTNVTPVAGGGPPTVTPPTSSAGPVVAASVPTAPGNPTAKAGDKSATVTWTPPNSHGSPITGYTVTWTAGGGGSVSVSGTRSSAQVTNLKNGTTYTFSVKAANAIGTGPAAQTAPVTPTSTVPSAPTGVAAKAQSNGALMVSWTAADGQGHVISSYEVTATPAGGTSLAPVSVASTTVVFSTQQGIVIGTAYTFTVTATNDQGGTSKPSAASSAVTASTAPMAVAKLSATDNGRGSLSVSWTCDTQCASGSPLTEFTVSLSPSVSGTPAKVPAVSGQSSYKTTVTGLADQTTYTVTVTASNQAWGPGQPAVYHALTEGNPTASVSPSWNGLTLTLGITVTGHGATVTGCSVALSGPGGNPSVSGACGPLSMAVPYYDATYAGTVTVHSDQFGTTTAANVSTGSGPKVLDATAQQNFTCTGNSNCGRGSASCQTTKFTKALCDTNVAAGTPIDALCWTTGTRDQGIPAGSASSTVWVDVSGQTYSWMSQLWFDPYQTVQNNLLQCS